MGYFFVLILTAIWLVPLYFLFRKFKRGKLILFIFLLAVSVIPYVNFLSPFTITTPVFGKVINAITGEPIPGYRISSRLNMGTFQIIQESGYTADEIETRTNRWGYFFIRPHFVFKSPFFAYYSSQGIHFTYLSPYEFIDEQFYNFLLFRYIINKYLPPIVNTKLCANPEAKFRPDGRDVKKCITNMSALIFNNTPELCEQVKCNTHDDQSCKYECKKNIWAIYQNISEKNDCKTSGINFDEDCVISKAINFKNFNFCYQKKEDESTILNPAKIVFCLTILAYRMADATICDEIPANTNYGPEQCRYYVNQINAMTLSQLGPVAIYGVQDN